MAGIVIADEDEHVLRGAVAECRRKLTVPSGRPMHWQDHAKVFPRRDYVARQFAAVPATVNFVIFEKAAIPAQSALRGDQVKFYNYTAGYMIERLLLTAHAWPGGSRDLIATFAHVRGFDHKETAAYFAWKRIYDPDWVPWHRLHGSVRFESAGSRDGLQAADCYAGMLKVAMCENQYGGYEAQHLMTVRSQVRRVNGKAWGYGFKVMATPLRFESLPWWPAEGF